VWGGTFEERAAGEKCASLYRWVRKVKEKDVFSENLGIFSKTILGRGWVVF
jgi:hypothetical protein